MIDVRQIIAATGLAFSGFAVVCCNGKPGNSQGHDLDGGGAILLPEPPMGRLRISIFELIAQPERFSGEIISVTGYLKMDVEEQLLFASEEFARVGVLENSVAIEATGCTNENDVAEQMNQLVAAKDSYVTVRGRLMKADPGKYPFQSGRICSIQRIGREHP
jgi:hypothetical protein